MSGFPLNKDEAAKEVKRFTCHFGPLSALIYNMFHIDSGRSIYAAAALHDTHRQFIIDPAQ